MSQEARRAAVRQAYAGRCGYCTVHESEAGAELEIDHFQPRSAGGSDDLDNLAFFFFQRCPYPSKGKADITRTTAPRTRPHDEPPAAMVGGFSLDRAMRQTVS
jgi:hypothetical protein